MFPRMLICTPPSTRSRSFPRVWSPREASARQVGLHHRRAAAVNVDRAAGHIGGSIGGEERRDIGEFFGAAHTAQRHRPPRLGNEILERDIGALAAMAAHDLVADDDADMQRVDEYVVRSTLS